MLVRLTWFPITAFSSTTVFAISSLFLIQYFKISGKSSEVLFGLAMLAAILYSNWLAAQRNRRMEIAMLVGAITGVLFGAVTWGLFGFFRESSLIKSALIGSFVFMIGGNLLGMLAYVHIVNTSCRRFTNFAQPLVGIFGGNFALSILASTNAQSGVFDSLRFYLTNLTSLTTIVNVSKSSFLFGLASGFFLFLIATFAVFTFDNRRSWD